MLSEDVASYSSGWSRTYWLTEHNLDLPVLYVMCFDKRSATILSSKGLILLLKLYFWAGLRSKP